MKKPRPSDLELQVLSVLWQAGPSTVRQVLRAMPDGKSRAYTTILSVMQVMEKKGLLAHTRRGLAHVYAPRVRRSQVLRPIMKELLQNVFGGRTSAAVQYLLDGKEVDADELAEIRRLIQQAGRPRNRGGKR